MVEWFSAVITWWCDPWHILSAAMSLIALLGTIWNAERNKWGFAFWLVSNLYMSINFFNMGSYAESTLFFIYFLLAIRGVYVWIRKEAQDRKAVEQAAATGVANFEENE